MIFAKAQVHRKLYNNEAVVLSVDLHLTGTDVALLYDLSGLDITIPNAVRDECGEAFGDEVDLFLTDLRQKLDAAGVNTDNVLVA